MLRGLEEPMTRHDTIRLEFPGPPKPLVGIVVRKGKTSSTGGLDMATAAMGSNPGEPWLTPKLPIPGTKEVSSYRFGGCFF